MSGGLGSRTTAPDDDDFQITYEAVEVGQGVCVGMGHEKQIAELEDRCVRAEEAQNHLRLDFGLVADAIRNEQYESALSICESRWLHEAGVDKPA